MDASKKRPIGTILQSVYDQLEVWEIPILGWQDISDLHKASRFQVIEPPPALSRALSLRNPTEGLSFTLSPKINWALSDSENYLDIHPQILKNTYYQCIRGEETYIDLQVETLVTAGFEDTQRQLQQ